MPQVPASEQGAEPRDILLVCRERGQPGPRPAAGLAAGVRSGGASGVPCMLRPRSSFHPVCTAILLGICVASWEEKQGWGGGVGGGPGGGGSSTEGLPFRTGAHRLHSFRSACRRCRPRRPAVPPASAAAMPWLFKPAAPTRLPCARPAPAPSLQRHSLQLQLALPAAAQAVHPWASASSRRSVPSHLTFAATSASQRSAGTASGAERTSAAWLVSKGPTTAWAGKLSAKQSLRLLAQRQRGQASAPVPAGWHVWRCTTWGGCSCGECAPPDTKAPAPLPQLAQVCQCALPGHPCLHRLLPQHRQRVGAVLGWVGVGKGDGRRQRCAKGGGAVN